MIALDAIAFDAGTQVRAALDEQVVAEYAARMGEGAVFPPIVLFHDGTRHYLADGFHRYMASQRLGLAEIAADVRAGTREDALWFALGANNQNGIRLTLEDKKHAIRLALTTCPHRTQSEIARQVACSQQFVSQVVAQITATCEVLHPRPHRYARISAARATEIEEALRAGRSTRAIARALKASVHTVARIREQHHIPLEMDRAPETVQQRHARIRTMAGEGYTTRQIAAAVGLGGERIHQIAKRDGIDISADRAVGNTRRHDSNRIVSRIVMDAENLIESSELIDYAKLDRAQVAGWLASLKQSRQLLGTFIRRLMQEQATHGEAA